jgi:hypothetical protein
MFVRGSVASVAMLRSQYNLTLVKGIQGFVAHEIYVARMSSY